MNLAIASPAAAGFLALFLGPGSVLGQPEGVLGQLGAVFGQLEVVESACNTTTLFSVRYSNCRGYN